MSSMETFIIIAGFMASGIGTLILLLNLARKRSQLVEAFNFQQEMERRQQRFKENKERANRQQTEPLLGAASSGSG